MSNEREKEILEKIKLLEAENQALQQQMEGKILTLNIGIKKKEEIAKLQEEKESLVETYLFLKSISPSNVDEYIYNRYLEIKNSFQGNISSIFYKNFSEEDIFEKSFEIEKLEEQISGVKNQIILLIKEKNYVSSFKEKIKSERIEQNVARVIKVVNKFTTNSSININIITDKFSFEELQFIMQLTKQINNNAIYQEIEDFTNEQWLTVAKCEKIFFKE